MIKIPVKKAKASNKVENPPKNPGPQATPGPPTPALEASPYFPIIDKLTVTLWVTQADHGVVSKAVHQAIKDEATFAPAKKSAMYETVKSTSLEGSTERVHFMFGRKKSHLPDARLEFNPAKLGAEGMTSLDKVLGTIFPGGWGYIVEHGRVSKLEIAIDFPGLRMHHFHVLPDMVLTSKAFEVAGKLKTVYSGKPKGNQLKVYSKSYEIWVKAKKPKGQKGPPVVRVEKRLRNVGKNLKDLPELDNPFLGFKLVTYPPEPPADASKAAKMYWPLFLDSVAARGLGPALKLLPENQQPIFRKHFAAHVQEWWDPQAIWSNWPETLGTLKIPPSKGWI